MTIIQRPALATGWPTLDSLFNLRQELSRFTESPWADFQRQPEFFNDWAPALDVLEDANNLQVVAELPGLRKEDIDISLKDGVLSITGERKAAEQKEEQTHRSERFYGRFHRSITLPKPVDGEHVQAVYRDGVLTITLPKSEQAKPRQIQVVAA
jgi:HSP20 family protein